MQVSLFYHNVAGWLEKSVLPWILRDFLEHLFCVTCERLLLVLVRIGLVWRAANLLIFWIIVYKSVFQILGYSFQLILHWCTPNQRTNLKVGLSPFKKKIFYLLRWNRFKNGEESFLFLLKSSFRSQDISIIVLKFWTCRRKGLSKKIRLI